MRQTSLYRNGGATMNKNFIPKIACRFKIRKDPNDTYLGFFHLKGVLTFNEIGAYIVSNIDGKRTIDDIANQVNAKFSAVENPLSEVKNIVKQLQNAGFIS
ncbi:PqqD family protein [Candidatus Parcubacteria bacterium]|nr:PqqD family protein [Patescibacteria group bacterium]MCG2686703.1 PqqD family protein [Candidatus Parcubacteria bacterium]